MGKPVIATRVGGNIDCIRDRDNGLLIPDGDPLSIYESAMELIQDRNFREMLGERGRMDVVENWTWTMKVREIHELYANLLSRTR
jgi:glycosyltransferase involved in cell wall biosynthesis